MSWIENSVGCFSRPLGENEKLIRFIGQRAKVLGREQWSIRVKAALVLKAELSSDQVSQVCRRAWASLRFQQPNIATSVSEEQLHYEVPNDQSLQNWLNATFIDHPEIERADDILAGLKPGQYATAHFIRSDSSIMLHLSHWRTDGYGAIMLAANFIQNIYQEIKLNSSEALAWGEETVRLAPCVEDALDLPSEAPDDVEALAKSYLQTAALAKDAIGMKAPVDNKQPGGTRMSGMRFTESETRHIASAYQDKKISLVAAVHATCAQVTNRKAAEADQLKPYTSTIRLNLRPLMPSPYDGESYAANICTGGYFVRVSSDKTWTQNAEMYTALYEHGASDDFLRSRREYARQALKMLESMPVVPSLASEIDISNVGELDMFDRINDNCREVLEVVDVSIGVETLTRQVYCFTLVQAGQLALQLYWNEAYYTNDFVHNILSSMKQTILTELGIE